MLRDTAELYELDTVLDSLITSLNLESRETNDPSLLTNIWFMNLLNALIETINSGVGMYRQTRSASRLSRSVSSRIGNARHRTDPTGPFEEAPPPVTVSANDLAQVRVRLVTAVDQTRTLVEAEAEITSGAPRTETRPNQTLDRKAGSTVDKRKASYDFQYIKGNRFTGELKQSIKLTIRDYTFCARQHRLTPSQKADYFVNIFDGLARTRNNFV